MEKVLNANDLVKEFKEINSELFKLLEEDFEGITKENFNSKTDELVIKIKNYNKDFDIIKNLLPEIMVTEGKAYMKGKLTIQGDNFKLIYNKHFKNDPKDVYCSFDFQKENFILHNDGLVYFHLMDRVRNAFDIELKDLDFKPLFLKIEVKEGSDLKVLYPMVCRDFESSDEFKKSWKSGNIIDGLKITNNLNVESIKRLIAVNEDIAEYNVNIIKLLIGDESEEKALNEVIEIDKLKNDSSDLEDLFKTDKIIGNLANYKELFKINKKESFLKNKVSKWFSK